MQVDPADTILPAEQQGKAGVAAAHTLQAAA
jgi:hypothetical protein